MRKKILRRIRKKRVKKKRKGKKGIATEESPPMIVVEAWAKSPPTMRIWKMRL